MLKRLGINLLFFVVLILGLAICINLFIFDELLQAGTGNQIKIKITSPREGESLSTGDMLVEGTITTKVMNTGIRVNGAFATVIGGKWFANNVPITKETREIKVVASDIDGNNAESKIYVNVNNSQHPIELSANITSGMPPFETYFRIDTNIPNSVNSFMIDYEGDGVFDFKSNRIEDVSYKYKKEGIFHPNVEVKDSKGNIYIGSMAIGVINTQEMNKMLKGIWDDMKKSLLKRDVNGAVECFVDGSKEKYRKAFEALRGNLPVIMETFIEFNITNVYEHVAEYEVVSNENGVRYSYPGSFIQDSNGVWKFKDF